MEAESVSALRLRFDEAAGVAEFESANGYFGTTNRRIFSCVRSRVREAENTSDFAL